MTEQLLYAALIWFACVNVIGFIMTGLDKIWAIRKQWRIAEKWFFRMALIGSGLGIFLGCIVFNHKIRSNKFMIGIPVVFVLETGVGLILYSFLIIT